MFIPSDPRGALLYKAVYRHAKAKDRPRSRPGRSAPQTEAAFRRHLGDILSDIDLLPIPSAAGEAPEGLCSTGDPNLNAMRTLAWTPCVTLPFGAGPNGLALGLQLVGPRFRDEAVLAATWGQSRL